MNGQLEEKELHSLFEIGVVLKGINAALELVFGVLLMVVDVSGIVQALINNALIEDPDSFLAVHLRSYADHLTPGAEFYSGIYLLSHGLIKIFLVWGLLRGKLWSYPASLAVLFLFVLYQTFSFARTYSIVMLLLTVFDLILMILIYHEYRRKTEKK